MKLIAFCASFLMLVATAEAQYAIDWFTVDGGGGLSSGGAYMLTGTIGQPDAAIASGGGYTLEGGFWSGFASTPTEPVPSLRIENHGASVTLAWPAPATGFQLEEATTLTAATWTNVNAVPTVVGGEQQVNQPLAPTARFYRLRKP